MFEHKHKLQNFKLTVFTHISSQILSNVDSFDKKLADTPSKII